MRDLRDHLERQRQTAALLIRTHNNMLRTLLAKASGDSVRKTITSRAPLTEALLAPATPAAPGRVIHLFDYAEPDTPGHQQPIASTKADFATFPETQLDSVPDNWRNAYYQILEQYGADDALAVNRKHLAGDVLFTPDLSALFFFKSQSGVMFVVCYAGPDVDYPEALEELKRYADSQQLQANLMAREQRVAALEQAGFSTTPLGVWQHIEPLDNFTLDGQKMRRLRYLVRKYTRCANCGTREYRPGDCAETDTAICNIIDRWVDLKGTTPAFVEEVKQRVMAGNFGTDHRFFLTWRNDHLDNIMVFSRDNQNDGYLMDLEFYAADMPLGSTEFALSEIIACLKAENRQRVSLGLTMGTGLFEHENGSEDVHKLFEQLRKTDMLNGDANAQYKNKYRPVTVEHISLA